MATEKDLINVRDSMEAEGLLNRMKAEMRSQVLRLLGAFNNSDGSKKVAFPHQVFVLNELIREYLDWMKYKCTSTVFLAESDLGKQPLDRTFLLRELQVEENDETEGLPLLFCLLETFKQFKRV